jgi:endoglycosylceramidase
MIRSAATSTPTPPGGRRRPGTAASVLLMLAAALLVGLPMPSVDAVQSPLPGPIADWSTTTGTDGRTYIADGLGRARRFHGANHKTSDPDTLTDDLLAAAAQRGIDHIRLAFFWQHLEPTQDGFDETYLDKVVAALDRAAAHGILVILDMHQDVFGEAFGSVGVPAWATRTDGLPFDPQPVWLQNYLQPAVQAAFDHLYEDADLRQQQIEAWLHVVNRVKGHPAVLGYDLLNEPFGQFRPGEDFLSAAARVEREQLTPMYQRLTDAISAVDPHHWVFFEPPNLASLGVPTSLGAINGPKVAIYPHMYDASIETATYTPGFAITYNPAFFSAWANATVAYTAAHPVPMLVGEWGIAHPEAGGMDQFVRDSLATMEQVTSGWSQFNWCQGDGYCPIDAAGNDRPGIGQIFQPYPRATAGSPTSTRWDPTTRELRVRYRDSTASGPTEIFIPESRSYPTGWTVEASAPAGTWSSSFDASRGVLSVNVADSGTDQAICLKPVGAPAGCTALDPVVPTPIAGPVPAAATPIALTPAFTG